MTIIINILRHSYKIIQVFSNNYFVIFLIFHLHSWDLTVYFDKVFLFNTSTKYEGENMLPRISIKSNISLEETVKNLFVVTNMEQFLKMQAGDLTRH